jgi:uncharacterized membrane protein
MTFVGRFHPLIVHFPIALLLLAFSFEFLSRRDRFRELNAAVVPTLLIGSVSAILSAITGYILSYEGGYNETALGYHRWAGLATASVSVVVLLVKYKKVGQGRLLTVLFVVLALLVVTAGHLGAGLTHGEDFLTEYAPWNTHEELPFELPVIDNVDSAVMYADIVRPMLEHRCFACHSAKRQKGNLRMDSEEFLRKGGKHGDLLTKGSSELCKRITLPLEAEHHMPPNERDQPSSAEIELLVAWVEDGAGFETRVASMNNAEHIKAYWNVLQAKSSEPWLPSEASSAGNAEAIAALSSAGVLIQPVARDNNYLIVNFINAHTFIGVKSMLKTLDRQIVDLRLDGQIVPDSLLMAIGRLSNLRKLSFAYASFPEAQLQSIMGLPELRFVNLVGTNATDETLSSLAQIKSLRKVYLYKTRVTPAGIASAMIVNPALEIDTGGYELPKLVTDTLVYHRKG